MLLFDYLLCNEDRHLNNFGILRGDETGAFRFPPLSAQMCDYCSTILNPSHLSVLLFGMNGKATSTATRLDKFFANRCFPSTRQNAKKLLAITGLSLYQPKLICRKTHGIVAHDHFWLKYADDPPERCYADLLHEMSKAIRITPGDKPTSNE